MSKCMVSSIPVFYGTIPLLSISGKWQEYQGEATVSVSQLQQSEDLHDQTTILVGSAIRLLCGEAGAFVVAKEAFDPQSSTEYTLYQLSESALPVLLSSVGKGLQPTSTCPLVVNRVGAPLADALGILFHNDNGGSCEEFLELCSLRLQDSAGILGVIHYLRPVGAQSCFERHRESDGSLRLFIAHLSAGLRAILKSQALMKEQGRLAAIFHYSAEGILIVDNEFRIIDFNPAMEKLTGWQESEVLGRLYYEVLDLKDRQGNTLAWQDSPQNLPIHQAFAG